MTYAGQNRHDQNIKVIKSYCNSKIKKKKKRCKMKIKMDFKRGNSIIELKIE